jgi:hypothetical protein
VAIIGGDPVVCGSLEALLQAAGYRVRFLRVGEDLGEMLASFRVLLVAPGLDLEQQEALDEVLSAPATLGNISVLELLPADGGRNVRRGRVIPWPCSARELERAIDAVLFEE